MQDSKSKSTPAEILVIIAFIVVLGSVISVNFITFGESRRIDLQRAQFELIANAMDEFHQDFTRFPTEEEGIKVLWKRGVIQEGENQKRWRRYIKRPITSDRWGKWIIYRNPAQLVGNSHYDLVSCGPDGVLDTKDDITNQPDMANAEQSVKAIQSADRGQQSNSP